MEFVNRIFLAGFVFSALICDGSCIRCFQCNSIDNAFCQNVTLEYKDFALAIVPVLDCPDDPINKITYFCRKIVQNIHRFDNETLRVRTIRDCGWVRNEPKKDCYTVKTWDHHEIVCQCFHDHCNASDSLDSSSSVFIFLALSAVLYFY